MPADNFAGFFVGDNMEIWTDASFDQHRKVAGLGIFIKKGLKEKSYSIWIPADNINVAEIFAIYLACILSGGEKSTIHTDSMTSLAYIKKEVRENKPRTREQYINHNKMKFWAYKIRKFDFDFVWTKGHRKGLQIDSLNNNVADINAKKGLGKFYLTLSKERVR